jgi:type 1 fimbria pilin
MKIVQFPFTGTVTASYHTAGTEIVGQASNNNEKVIAVDDLLIAPVFLDKLSEAKTHYDVRSIYTSEAGHKLAKAFDQNVLRCMVLAARSSAIVTGLNGGTVATSATTLYKTSATDLAAGIFLAMQTMDEKDVSETEPRWTWVKPAQYYLLAQSVNLINKDWGGEGAYADGKIVRIAGSELVKTNNLPTADDSANVNIPTKYRADFTKVAAVVTNRFAAGTVKLLDLNIEAEYDIRRQGTLIVASYAVGHDTLRPDCAVELRTTT